jgi:hypothetical protein
VIGQILRRDASPPERLNVSARQRPDDGPFDDGVPTASGVPRRPPDQSRSGSIVLDEPVTDDEPATALGPGMTYNRPSR